MEFITRAYNKIEFDKTSGTILKTSNEDRLVQEISFYNNLPLELKHYFPHMISYENKEKPYKMKLEYFPFKNLGMLLADGLSEQKWQNVSHVINHALQKFALHTTFPASKSSFNSARYNMFITKTEKEYNNLVSNFPQLQKLSAYSVLKVNGVDYINFHIVWDELKEFVYKTYCKDEKFSLMHGDLCFSNILCGFDNSDNAVVKFLDPRGAFGPSGAFCATEGDVYYDLAKLMHSLDGKYENIIYDMFDLSIIDNNINFSFIKTDIEMVAKIFDKNIFQKFDKLKIKLIQGLIFIGMCARHYDSLNRQIVMYATGVRILNECLEEIRCLK
jgi:hypothetical protein